MTYKVILITENKTWEEALFYCRENYRDLVSITNLEEQKWVEERARKMPPLLMSGWDCATPVLWNSGSGSTMKWSCIKTGLLKDTSISVTLVEPWAHKDNISGSKNDNEKFNFMCSKF